MNMRNLLNAGDYVVPIPMGIHLTLQYNSSGNLQKVYMGYTQDRSDCTDKLMDLLINNNLIPAKIHIVNGTSWIYGVLYTGFHSSKSGTLPNAVESDLASEFINNPLNFNFFAGNIESTATTFVGASAVRRSLALARFRVLPGWMIPCNFTNEIVHEWITSPQYTFMPIITDYIIFHKDNISIKSACLNQFFVDSISKYVDDNGYVKSEVTLKESDMKLCMDYSEIVKWDIHTGSLVIIDTEKTIIFCKNKIKVKKYDSIITCSYCGKRYEIPTDGLVVCPDIHCPSRLMRNIIQFIRVLKLQMFDSTTISNWLKSKTVTCIPDLLLLDEYKDKTVDISISELLSAMIPSALIAHEDLYAAFAIACSNNEQTLKYYINHPCEISNDLGLHHIELNKLIAWLSDGCNASDLVSILDSPQINIVATKAKFNGAPIFRNKRIFLTGKFIRGSINDIASILQSYSATVTTQFSNLVDCVLVGGLHEEVDGKAINFAKAMNKPVFDENDFFARYEIDADIKANLV